MSREIKFRAWSTFHNKKELIYLKEFTSKDLKSCDNWKVMQWTGLKDKNGKEIYEDDIVSIEHIVYKNVVQYSSELTESYRYIAKCICKYYDGKFVFTNGIICLDINVFWMRGCASGNFVRKKDEYGRYFKDVFTFLELTGNIYENPELLREGE